MSLHDYLVMSTTPIAFSSFAAIPKIPAVAVTKSESKIAPQTAAIITMVLPSVDAGE